MITALHSGSISSGIPEGKVIEMKWKGQIRRAVAVLTAVNVMLTFVGCGMFAQLDLTNEDSSLIAEYAAGLLRKYDRNHGKLWSPEELEKVAAAEDAQEQEVEEPDEENAADDTLAAEEEFASDGEEPDMNAEVQELSGDGVNLPAVDETVTMAEAIGIQDIEIDYTDYEVCGSYPANEDGSFAVSMSARDGRKLLVLHFNVSNPTDVAQECNILHAGKFYRLMVNGNVRINEQVTVLLNSLSQYEGALAPGESMDGVLIFEAENALAENISSMDLIVKDDDGLKTVNLF